MENPAAAAPANNSIEFNVDRFLEHVSGVTDNMLNARWDDVNAHIAALDEMAVSVDADNKLLFEALYLPVKETALGFREFTTAKTDDDRTSALDHLTRAKTSLQKTKAEQPELAKDSGFRQLAQGVELNILNVQEQIARARNDVNAGELIKQQRDQLLNEIQADLDPDDPMRFFHEALKLYGQALPKFNQGIRCLVEMNLDQAQDYLAETSQIFATIRDLLDQTKADSLIIQAGKDAVEGFAELVAGQETYVRVMRTAIIGDVTRGDVEALEKAERSFVSGNALLGKAAVVLPSAFGNLDFASIAQMQSRLVANLRVLCERSLTPKAITMTTAPKVIFYFVGTFLVLLVALPVSGLVARIQTTELGLLLIVSLLVSLLGAFGFEATRFVPLLDVFSRMLPWASQKSAKAAG